MLHVFIRRADGTISRDSSRKSLTEAIRDPQVMFWLDMEAPTEAEMSLLSDVFQIHPLAIEDIRHHLQRPKVEGYRRNGHTEGAFDYFYIVVHAPNQERMRAHDCPEIDILFAERYLLTVHDSQVPAI